MAHFEPFLPYFGGSGHGFGPFWTSYGDLGHFCTISVVLGLGLGHFCTISEVLDLDFAHFCPILRVLGLNLGHFCPMALLKGTNRPLTLKPYLGSLKTPDDQNVSYFFNRLDVPRREAIEFFLPVTIVIIPDMLVTNLITKLY